MWEEGEDCGVGEWKVRLVRHPILVGNHIIKGFFLQAPACVGFFVFTASTHLTVINIGDGSMCSGCVQGVSACLCRVCVHVCVCVCMDGCGVCAVLRVYFKTNMRHALLRTGHNLISHLHISRPLHQRWFHLAINISGSNV